MIRTNLYITGMAGITREEPDYKNYIPDAGLRRRMSRVIRMSVASALMALEDSGRGETDAIVTGTGWGCLADTEKFLISILENSERLLNPSSFIQSTSNTIGAQIALMLEDKHYNSTYVHGGSSFESALLDSSLLISEGKKRILAGGFDELTLTKSHLLERMGMWKKYIPGEGSHFFVLEGEKGVHTHGRLAALEILPHGTSEEEVLPALKRFLAETGTEKSAADILCGDHKLLPLISEMGFNVKDYKMYCGEYPTASACALHQALISFREQGSPGRVVIVSKYINDVTTFMLTERV